MKINDFIIIIVLILLFSNIISYLLKQNKKKVCVSCIGCSLNKTCKSSWVEDYKNK